MPESGGSGVQAIGSSVVVDAIQRLARRRRAPSTASPRKRTSPSAQHRLVLDVGEDAEGVLARHVGRGQDRREPGVRGSTTPRDRRARSARAHAASARRAATAPRPAPRRRRTFAAGDLRPAVEPRNARADAGFPLRLRERPTRAASGEGPGGACPWPLTRSASAESPLPASGEGEVASTASTILHVAGAAAEHAAERVLDLAARRRGLAREKVGRGHQHAGRADAALGGAVVEERAAQALASRRRGRHLRRCRPAAPSACAAGTRQAQTCAPSSSTVQAPQSPASQPILVPVRPSSSRRRSASVSNGAAWTATRFAVDGEQTPLSSRRRAGTDGPSCGPPPRAAPQAAEEVAGERLARRRGDRRRSPARHRGAASSARSPACTSVDSAGVSGCPRSRSSRARSRRATGEQDADHDAGMVHRAVGIGLDDGGRHHDRDHEVAAGAELQERAACRRASLRDAQRRDDLVLAAGGVAVAVEEALERLDARAAKARDLDLGLERQEIGDAVAGRRGGAEIAGERRRGSESARRRSPWLPPQVRRRAAASRRGSRRSRSRVRRCASARPPPRCAAGPGRQ